MIGMHRENVNASRFIKRSFGSMNVAIDDDAKNGGGDVTTDGSDQNSLHC